MNLRRAGRLKNSERTSTLVPGALPAALTSTIFPPLTMICVPSGESSVALARGEREPADAGDAGQRFAAKSHRRDGGQVFGFPDFAGGVPFEAEQGVVAAHAQAVVDHAHEAAPAGLDFHRDARGLRIERVLDEFLHDAGRPLNHLAGGDLIGDLFGQQADAVHCGGRVARAGKQVKAGRSWTARSISDEI